MTTAPPATSPLSGITVLALEQAIAAPLCTRHLADLGARVIKIEQPGTGDASRHYDGVVRGLAAHFVWLNHGKQSAALDLTDPSDRDVFTALLERADVLVSNLAPGALGRLGLEPATLGLPGQPAKSGIPVADIGTALYAYSSVLAALYERERTGRGAVIPVAMLDVAAEMMGFALNQVLHGGGEPEPVGMGSPVVAPYGAYPTADGQTAVLGTTSDREWRRLTNDLLERPDQAGIGNARLNGVTDLAEHEQLKKRGRWRQVGSEVGPVPALLPPALATGWPAVSGRVPALGEDTDAIRAEVGDPG
jgi:itaconate CoA-transferase